MLRMARVALAALLTVSAVLAQELPFGGIGEVRDPGHPGDGGFGAGGIGLDPGGPGGGDIGAGGLPSGTDLFGSAAQVSQFDGLPGGFFGPGSDSFSWSHLPGTSPLDLSLSPGLQEAAQDSLERGYGISGHMLEITDAPLGSVMPGSGPAVQRRVHADPADPGALCIEPWWQGGIPAPPPIGGGPAPVQQNPPGANGPDPGGPPQGSPQRVLIDVPAIEPVSDDPNQRLVSPWGSDGPNVAEVQELINGAAAGVVSNRVARAIDPNSRASRGASPDERRTRGRLGLVWLQVLDGQRVSGEDTQFLRQHLDVALALLDGARRGPREGDPPLQLAIDRSACAIVDSIRAALAR